MANLTLKKRIWILSGSLMLGIVGLSLFSNQQARTLNDQLKDVTGTQLPAVRTMTLADMNHDGIRGVLFETLHAGATHDQKRVDELVIEMKKMTLEINEHLEKLATLGVSKEVVVALEKANPLVKEYAESGNELVGLVAAGKTNEAEAKLSVFTERFEVLEKSLGTLGEMIEGDVNKARDGGAHATTLITIISLLVLIYGFFMSFFMIRKINQILSQLYTQFSATVNSMYTTSSALSKLSNDVATSTNQQAQAIQESSSALAEISSMVTQTTENTKKSLQSSALVFGLSNEGRSVMDQMATAMHAIEGSNVELKDIAKVIEEIGTKASVINDIVFKTQLLSFNASIEAARAGEQGRGFSVVAEEVGELAKLSGNAAKSIQDLLDQSKTKVNNALIMINDRVKDGQMVSEQVFKNFKQIADSIEDIQSQMSDTSAAAIQQQSGLVQTTRSVNELDSASKHNSDSANEVQKVSGDLGVESEKLKTVTRELGLLISGNDQTN